MAWEPPYGFRSEFRSDPRESKVFGGSGGRNAGGTTDRQDRMISTPAGTVPITLVWSALRLCNREACNHTYSEVRIDRPVRLTERTPIVMFDGPFRNSVEVREFIRVELQCRDCGATLGADFRGYGELRDWLMFASQNEERGESQRASEPKPEPKPEPKQRQVMLRVVSDARQISLMMDDV